MISLKSVLKTYKRGGSTRIGFVQKEPSGADYLGVWNTRKKRTGENSEKEKIIAAKSKVQIGAIQRSKRSVRRRAYAVRVPTCQQTRARYEEKVSERKDPGQQELKGAKAIRERKTP